MVVNDVVKSFGTIKALRGVSVRIARSEFVTITGPSGSGKSTLLNLIGSLDRPDSGSVEIGGVPVPEPRRQWSSDVTWSDSCSRTTCCCPT